MTPSPASPPRADAESPTSQLATAHLPLPTCHWPLATDHYVRPGPGPLQRLPPALRPPLILPQIVTGAALLQFFALSGLRDLLGLPALLLGHVVITLPYVVRTVTVSLHGVDRQLEWAAQDLGANPLQTFFRVTLPLIKNGVFAGFVFAFIV